jgi:hypothetical protein
MILKMKNVANYVSVSYPGRKSKFFKVTGQIQHHFDYYVEDLSNSKVKSLIKFDSNKFNLYGSDEIYQIALADRKFMTTVIQIQEQELFRADKVIQTREAELMKLRNSWWERNKVAVGIGVGILGGMGLTLAAGIIWAQIEEEKVTQ